MDSEYFIVRDEDPMNMGDVATVWNYRLRQWAWDIDGYYEQGDFAYVVKANADARAKVLAKETGGMGYSSRPIWHNVRVVTRDELDRLRQ